MMRKLACLALLPLAVTASCSEEALDLQSCFRHEDCGGGTVCFFGACVDPNYQISTVYSELQPRNDSLLLTQQYPREIQLADGYQELSLQAAVRFDGRVVVGDGSGATMNGELAARMPGIIPGREVSYKAAVMGDGGFGLDTVPGHYDLTFTPGPGMYSAKPPYSFIAGSCESMDLSGTRHDDLPYPSDAELITVRGKIKWVNNVETGVEGARVVVTADGPCGELRSSPTETNDLGEFAVELLAGADAFDVHVGPGSQSALPEASFTDCIINPETGRLDPVALEIGTVVNNVTVRVQNEDGTPVSAASVLFSGEVSANGRFLMQTTTDENGLSFVQGLLSGTYEIVATPSAEQPYSIGASNSVTIPNGPIVDVTVGRKISLLGIIRTYEGAAAAGVAVRARLRTSPLVSDLRIAREFTTITDEAGRYVLAVDPGSADKDAEYEITVQPGPHSGLPLFYNPLKVGEDDVRYDIDLSSPTFANGTVRGPGGQPLPDVILSFYSAELVPSDRPDQSVLVGVVQSDSSGQFVLPVPTVSSP